MRLEQLQYIAAVIQHGSLRRAGDALHVSQPALSEAVRKLERELGVTLLDRRRSGAQVSREGRELFQHMVDVLDSVDRLRTAAGDQTIVSTIRVGTVNAANSTLLVPALRAFRRASPPTTVEVVSASDREILQGLTENTLDMGLVNVLPDDDIAPELEARELLHGRPVVCLRADHPLAGEDTVTIAQLREQPFVLMRAGFLMHRFVLQLLQGAPPMILCSTDGLELGKIMVAGGLGVGVLPDYCIDGDPLAEGGLITYRPIARSSSTVALLMLRRKVRRSSHALRQFQRLVAEQAAIAATASTCA